MGRPPSLTSGVSARARGRVWDAANYLFKFCFLLLGHPPTLCRATNGLLAFCALGELTRPRHEAAPGRRKKEGTAAIPTAHTEKTPQQPRESASQDVALASPSYCRRAWAGRRAARTSRQEKGAEPAPGRHLGAKRPPPALVSHQRLSSQGTTGTKSLGAPRSAGLCPAPCPISLLSRVRLPSAKNASSKPPDATRPGPGAGDRESPGPPRSSSPALGSLARLGSGGRVYWGGLEMPGVGGVC